MILLIFFMFALCVRKRDFDEMLGPQGVLDLGSTGTESANSFKTMISKELYSKSLESKSYMSNRLKAEII